MLRAPNVRRLAAPHNPLSGRCRSSVSDRVRRWCTARCAISGSWVRDVADEALDGLASASKRFCDTLALRRYCADTLALLVFSTLGALFTEIVIAGLSLSQSAHARLIALPVIIVTARPYGVYRDWVLSLFLADGEGQRLRRVVADTTAFLSFQLPIYWIILALAGASLPQIAVSSAGATVAILVSGRPYGVLLDLFRRLFGVPNRAPTAIMVQRSSDSLMTL
jgi:L-alanine exporter